MAAFCKWIKNIFNWNLLKPIRVLCLHEKYFDMLQIYSICENMKLKLQHDRIKKRYCPNCGSAMKKKMAIEKQILWMILLNYY